MSTMEWVYTTPPDSITLFEGDAHASPLPKSQPFDLFAPFQPVESAPAPEQEPEYYGAADLNENTLTPEAAFLKFAGIVYAPAEIAPASSTVTAPCASPRSRKERIAQVATELAALEQESEGPGESEPAENLSELRKQLSAIERSLSTKKAAVLPRRAADANKDRADIDSTKEECNKPATLRLVSPDVALITTLERRVGALEKMVGFAHDESCEGVALAPLMRDVKSRLDLLEDPSITERLKQDAKDIAEVLRREVHSDAGKQALQTAEVLRKMEHWEDVAQTVPVVVERLRCLKRVQDEAAGFVDTMCKMGETIDALSKRKEENEALIANVQRSMRENMQTVQRNLDLLDERLGHKS